MMNFVDGPFTPLTFASMIVLGTGMSGLYTAALYLINTYAYTQYRGYISGLANVFSVLGILVCSLLGGVIQDKWDKTGPFNLFAAMSFIGLVLVLLTMFRKKGSTNSDA